MKKLNKQIVPRKAIFFILSFIVFSSCSIFSPKGQRINDIQDQSKNFQLTSCVNTEAAFNCVEVVEVYDGDTIFINLPDQHPLFGKRMGVRILGINTPEIRTKNKCEKRKALKAKMILENMITKAKRVDVIDVKKDKFFRVLGNVIVDGRSVNIELINAKVAFPYYGEKKIKRDWCRD